MDRKNKKAEPCRLIPRKVAANLVVLTIMRLI